MAVAGQLLIQVAADTKALRTGLNESAKQAKSFADQIRSINADRRFAFMVARISGAVAAFHVLKSAVQDSIKQVQDLNAEAEKTGKSIEELSGGLVSTDTADRVTAMADSFAELANVVQSIGTEILGWAAPELTSWLKDVKDLLVDVKAAVATAKGIASGGSEGSGRNWLGFAIDSAGGPGGKFLRELTGIGGGGMPGTADAQGKRNDFASATESEKRAARQAIAAKKIEDEAFAKTMEALEANVDRMIEEDRKRAEELNKWAEQQEQHKAQIALDEMRAEEERLEDARKHAKELEKWKEEDEQRRAQIALDEAEREAADQKAAMEKRDAIIAGRGGVGSIEQGTQAAFSAINAHNAKREKIDEKQLGELRAINRNLKQKPQQLEVVEAT